MAKTTYRIAKFPSRCFRQNTCSKLSGIILRFYEHIVKMLCMYAFHMEYNLMILNNTIQNNETVVTYKESDVFSGSGTSSEVQSSRESSSSGTSSEVQSSRESSSSGTSSEGQSSQKPSSSLEEQTGSLCPTHKLQFKEKTKEVSLPENLETETSSSDSEGSDQLGVQTEMLNSTENDESCFFQEKKFERFNPEKEKTLTSNQDSKHLIETRINALSISEDDLSMKVEIDSSFTFEDSSPIKSEQDSSPSKKTNRTDKHKKGNRSPPSYPPERPWEYSPIPKDPLQFSDYMGSCNADFLARQFYSVLEYRKTCMEDKHNICRKLKTDLSHLKNTLDNIVCVMKLAPMLVESHLAVQINEVRRELIVKTATIKNRVMSIESTVDRDATIFKNCLEKIIETEDGYLAEKQSSSSEFGDFQRFELDLNETCENADATVIIDKKRKGDLSKLSYDFDRLIQHFVKFLIVSKILEPS